MKSNISEYFKKPHFARGSEIFRYFKCNRILGNKRPIIYFFDFLPNLTNR